MIQKNRSLKRISRVTTILVLISLVMFLLSANLGLVSAALFTDEIVKDDIRNSGGEWLGIKPQEKSRLEAFYMEAPQLRVRERAVYVYLPPDYFTSEKTYPVLYLHDGSMVFNTNGDHDTRFNRVLDKMFEDGQTDGIIMVGVASSYNRWDEYSPWVNENMDIWGTDSAQVEGGEGDAYLEFFVNTLKPEIDSRYRTLPDRENTAIGGFSMGGLISLYAGLKYPDVYSKVMAQSTAVWFAETDRVWGSNNQLLNLIDQNELPQNVRYYLDIGTNEWANKMVYVPDAQGNQLTYPFVWRDGTEKTIAALQASGVPAANLKLVIEEGGQHEAINWNGRFAEAIRFLFAAPAVIEQTATPTESPATATVVIPTETATMPAEPEATLLPVDPTDVVEPENTPTMEIVPIEEDSGDGSTIVILVTGILLILFSGFIFFWLMRGYSRNRN